METIFTQYLLLEVISNSKNYNKGYQNRNGGLEISFLLGRIYRVRLWLRLRLRKALPTRFV